MADMRFAMLGYQADTMIQLKVQKLSGIFHSYIGFVIHYIYSLVCKGIHSIPSQTNMQLCFYDMLSKKYAPTITSQNGTVARDKEMILLGANKSTLDTNI